MPKYKPSSQQEHYP